MIGGFFLCLATPNLRFSKIWVSDFSDNDIKLLNINLFAYY
jgi:hypothetical protein